MYLPKHFEVTDPQTIHAVLKKRPLATWATVVDGLPVVNHVPFMLDLSRGEHGTLVGHVARANPVWRTLGPSVLVFEDADGYVSPSWYPGKQQHGKVVPTWNYAVVHVHGVPRAIEKPEPLLQIVTQLTQVHESGRPAPWAVGDAPADYVAQLLKAIVGIEIPVQRWVGKFKLGQNRGADVASVVAGLRQLDPDNSLATLMQEHAPR